jgi:hypothetical protein
MRSLSILLEHTAMPSLLVSLDASLGKRSAQSKRFSVFSSRAAAKRLLSFKNVPQNL